MPQTQRPVVALSKRKYGLLTPLEPVNGGKFWLCRCDCGKTTKASRWHLENYRRRSCGCRHRPPEETYNCRMCKADKPIDEFYTRRRNGRLLYTVCKPCWSARCCQRSKLRNMELRLIALKRYGGDPPVCACCNESTLEFLVIDHIDGGGSTHRKQMSEEGTKSIYRWLFNHGYPEMRLRVLCSNCNSALGAYGYCPHERIDGKLPADSKYLVDQAAT